jgi:hypothetical protein
MRAPAYEYYLGKMTGNSEAPAITAGASGYFSQPSPGLDPRLFEGTKLLSDVREWVLSTVYDFWDKLYHSPHSWSTVWAAGSGVSYQWDADRGNGDLDILIGVDFVRFFDTNPSFQGMGESEMASRFNQEFHDELWPRTASWNGFVVTFYVNPGATNIRDIHPYAAYNITKNVWTVHPPKLPADPKTLYPQIYFDAAERERQQAAGLVERYTTLKAQSGAFHPGSPGWTNAMAAQRLVVQQASNLFDSIHLGRRNAFGPGGEGYGDFYNFRWQSAKSNGVVDALRALKETGDQASALANRSLYGVPLDNAENTLTRASLWNAGALGG